MIYLLTAVQVIVCVFLILVVLLQQGKSADFSGAFGGGSSQTSFGQRGTATLLSKATTVAAILFMVNTVALVIVSGRAGGSKSVIPANAPAKAPVSAPATPAAPAPANPPAAAPAAPTSK